MSSHNPTTHCHKVIEPLPQHLHGGVRRVHMLVQHNVGEELKDLWWQLVRSRERSATTIRKEATIRQSDELRLRILCGNAFRRFLVDLYFHEVRSRREDLQEEDRLMLDKLLACGQKQVIEELHTVESPLHGCV